MDMWIDYYKVLSGETEALRKIMKEAPHETIYQLGPHSRQAEIKNNYRTLVKICHPDIVQDVSLQKLAEEQIMQIIEAYNIFNNPSSRKKYDETYSNRPIIKIDRTVITLDELEPGEIKKESFTLDVIGGENIETIFDPPQNQLIQIAGFTSVSSNTRFPILVDVSITAGAYSETVEDNIRIYNEFEEVFIKIRATTKVQKPKPQTDIDSIELNDLEPRKVQIAKFELENIGGAYKNIQILEPADKRIKILTDISSINLTQPVQIEISITTGACSEAIAGTIKIILDTEATSIVINAKTRDPRYWGKAAYCTIMLLMGGTFGGIFGGLCLPYILPFEFETSVYVIGGIVIGLIANGILVHNTNDSADESYMLGWYALGVILPVAATALILLAAIAIVVIIGIGVLLGGG